METTFNVVIFAGGKFSRKCWQDLSRGGNCYDSTHISLIKSYGLYFRVGEMFVNKAISRKMRKLFPRENFHVYSIWRDVSKPPWRDKPWSSSPLIVSRDSLSPWTWTRFQLSGAYPTLYIFIYFWYTSFINLTCLWNDFMVCPLSLAVGLRSLGGWLFTNF